MRYIKNFILCAIIFFALLIPVAAQKQVIDIESVKLIAVPLHIIELFLAILISFIALKFFRITKPVSLFLIVYVAAGFFIINSLLYIMLYTADLFNFNISFVNVYVGSRIALIAMLISLGALFFYMYATIKKKSVS